MSLDATALRSRRAIIAAALGAAAATVASALGRPAPALAGIDGDVVLGGKNTETLPTTVTNERTSNQLGFGTAIKGVSTEGAGIWGESTRIAGVIGRSSEGPAVHGRSVSGPGIYGCAAPAAAVEPAAPAKTGVYGYAAQDEWSSGVRGETTDGTGVVGKATKGTGVGGVSDSGVAVWGWGTGGYGVYGLSNSAGVVGQSTNYAGVVGRTSLGKKGAVLGRATKDGTGIAGHSWTVAPESDAEIPDAPAKVGVYGVAHQAGGIGGYFSGDTALQVNGKAKFSRAKRVTISAGKSSLKVTLAGVTSSSLVFAVLHSNRAGVYVRAVVPSAGYFTIWLSKAVLSSTYVAYFVVN